jgi:hypothetical protein
LSVGSDCDNVEKYISTPQGKAEPHLNIDIQGMCESNLTSKSQLISRNLDLVLAALMVMMWRSMAVLVMGPKVCSFVIPHILILI